MFGVFWRIRSKIHDITFIIFAMVALVLGTLLAHTLWSEVGLVTIQDKYGNIPVEFKFTAPMAIDLS